MRCAQTNESPRSKNLLIIKILLEFYIDMTLFDNQENLEEEKFQI